MAMGLGPLFSTVATSLQLQFLMSVRPHQAKHMDFLSANAYPEKYYGYREKADLQ